MAAPESLITSHDIFSVVASIFTGCISALFATWNATKSKWWDKKEKAYGRIIEALYMGLKYYQEAAEQAYNPDAKDTEGLSERMEKKYRAIEWESAVGEFHICREASKVISEFHHRKRPDWNKQNPHDCIDQEIKTHKATLEKIRQIALDDLLGKWGWFRRR